MSDHSRNPDTPDALLCAYLDTMKAQIALDAAKIVDDNSARVRFRTGLVTSLFVLASAGLGKVYFDYTSKNAETVAQAAASTVYASSLGSHFGSKEFKSAVDVVTGERFRASTTEVEHLTDIVLLLNNVARIREGDSFDNRDAETAINALVSLYGVPASELPLEHKDLDRSLGELATAFTQAGNHGLLISLEKHFWDRLLEMDDTRTPITISIALALASFSAPPSKLVGAKNDQWETLFERYTVYSGAMRKTGNIGPPLTYDLLIAYLKGDTAESLVNRAVEIADFDDEDVELMISTLTLLIEASWVQGGIKHPKGMRASERTMELIKALSDKSPEFAELSEAAMRAAF